MDDLFNQIVNISKAGAYDIVSKQVQELQAENEKMRNTLKDVLMVIKESEHWWMDEPGRGGFDVPAIEEAIKQTKS